MFEVPLSCEVIHQILLESLGLLKSRTISPFPLSSDTLPPANYSWMLTGLCHVCGYCALVCGSISCQGAMFPAMHAMLGQWTPPMERSKLSGITYAGMNYLITIRFVSSI